MACKNNCKCNNTTKANSELIVKASEECIKSAQADLDLCKPDADLETLWPFDPLDDAQQE